MIDFNIMALFVSDWCDCLVNVFLYICSYVEKYNLGEPRDDIQHVLKHIAVKLRKTQRVKAITGVGKKRLIPQSSCHIH